MTGRVETSPTETWQDLEELLDQLTVEQIRFVVARQEAKTDKEAAKAIGISAGTVKNWKYAGVPLDEAVKLMAMDGVVAALHIRRKGLAKAMAIKYEGLESKDKRLQQSVATEFVEWELGKAKQRQEITGAEGKALLPVTDLIAALKEADRLLGDESGPGDG